MNRKLCPFCENLFICTEADFNSHIEFCNPDNSIIGPMGKKRKVHSQLDVQIDGDHYKHFAIQPAEFSFKNKFNWHQGEIVKYVSRYPLKHGRDDLEKARHLIDMLIEFEYDSP
jgi:hypothetical protein